MSSDQGSRLYLHLMLHRCGRVPIIPLDLTSNISDWTLLSCRWRSWYRCKSNQILKSSYQVVA